jgi:hypothetical protein
MSSRDLDIQDCQNILKIIDQTSFNGAESEYVVVLKNKLRNMIEDLQAPQSIEGSNS